MSRWVTVVLRQTVSATSEEDACDVDEAEVRHWLQGVAPCDWEVEID